jgi:hypothetical protein
MPTIPIRPPICGQNDVLPARLVGCGKEIESWEAVYRCTHCDVPFHKDCANTHFDGQALTDEQIDSMSSEEIDKWYVANFGSKKVSNET